MSTLQAVQVIKTPIGSVAIGATDKGISDIDILSPGNSRSEFSHSTLAQQHLNAAANQLQEYFAGKREIFELSKDISGTPFQVATWRQIASIGFGSVRSYGEIASAIGNPRASRAVGAAVGANPIPLLIGCHRVLGANQRLTGYSAGEGIKTKIWLLEHEGIGHK
jgi:methylated-DNA-[protein]-cysteine S-methyltransferase